MDPSVSQLVEDGRETLRESRNPNALEGGVLRVSETFDAKAVERRAALSEMESAIFNLDQMCDGLSRSEVLRANEQRHAREQLRVGDIGHKQRIHISHDITAFFELSDAH